MAVSKCLILYFIVDVDQFCKYKEITYLLQYTLNVFILFLLGYYNKLIQITNYVDIDCQKVKYKMLEVKHCSKRILLKSPYQKITIH